jgi:hypothetical protein
MITKTYLISFLFLTSVIAKSQVYYSPAIGLKSHETMEVMKVELSPEKAVIYLSVENRIKGGEFCADKNIFISYPDGSRSRMIKSNGIPQCPASYKFKKIGEKLEFSLTFPPLKAGTGWVDLIEDCNNNCFSVYGILFNADMSRKINEAVLYVDKGELDTAIGLYTSLISQAGTAEAGIAGSLYVDLIELLVRKGYKAQAADYYKKLVSSVIPRKELYLNNLNSRGIKF